MQEKTIINIIQNILEKIGIDFDSIDFYIDKDLDISIFSIKSKETRNIIGHQGETLYALSYLVKRAIEKKHPESFSKKSFIIDVDNYHGRHIEDLKLKARVIADRARSFKRRVELDPMSAYERMIIHSYLSKSPDIKTESVGQGKNRRLTIAFQSVL